MMLCLRTTTTQLSFPLCIRSSSSSSKHLTPHRSSSIKFKTMSTTQSKSQTIEHIVLFKVKQDTEPSKITSMINNLSSLISLDQVLHLTVGPLLRNRSTSLTFTHMLHTRYKTKQDLEAYSAHPSHVSVVKGNVLPIIDDIMAVDWIADDLNGEDLVPKEGSAMRVMFLKLKENVVNDKVLEVIKEIPENFQQIKQISYGQNFSPARAKGYSIASLAVFPGEKEMEEHDSNHELVKFQKDKVRDQIESVVAVDYVVPQPPPPQSASL